MRVQMFRAIFSGLLAALIAAAIPAPSFAQQEPVFVHSTCWKAYPGKHYEYEEFLAGDGKKLARAAIELGEFEAWTVSKSIIPFGEEAECHYIVARMYRKLPASFTLFSDAAYEKAGVKHDLDALPVWSSIRPVSAQLVRTVDGFGEAAVGDYYTVDYMKTADAAAWMDLERKVYRPVHEERAKNGLIKAWHAYSMVMPRGDGMPYDAATVNVLNGLPSLGEPPGYAEAFRKVHPNVDLDSMIEKTRKTRSIVRSTLHQIVARERAR